jgi:alkanesulfonate monooxygenase SsuD/methylene tetrahydromethanopterin reductase-like flavin-dependent oxidoreductase (luciferase family)
MATSAQVTANRANAQSSTGPRSVQGKAAASRNSLKLGLYAKSMIIAGEDPVELERLAASYRAQFEPVGPIEEELLDDIIRFAWMKRRFQTLETEIFGSVIANLPEDTPYLLGAAVIYDATHGDSINKTARRLAAAQRDWYKATDLLHRIQLIRRRAEAEAKACEDPDPEPLCESDAEPGNRVRFADFDQPSPDARQRPAPEPPVNVALRL